MHPSLLIQRKFWDFCPLRRAKRLALPPGGVLPQKGAAGIDFALNRRKIKKPRFYMIFPISLRYYLDC